MFNGPHRDVPCHHAPQVAYIVVFVTRWHKKSDGNKNRFFPFWRQTRNVQAKCRYALRERGIYVKLKIEINE